MIRCHSCLKEIQQGMYCTSCQRTLFHGITPHLAMDHQQFATLRYQLIEHFSMSGVQDKLSLRLRHNQLEATATDGQYILKPIPAVQVPQFQTDIPANEHITMQLAAQVYGIHCAHNGLIYFRDGEPAYITRRFDIAQNTKLRQEDFCQLAGLSPELQGLDFKYSLSYQSLGTVVNRYCAAAQIEMEKLFRRILFNYVVGNGDAHARNFSLIETAQGDFVLSPAYDLISTTLHFPLESRTALDLFDDFETEQYRMNGFYGFDDFAQLARFLRISEKRLNRMFDQFERAVPQAEAMLQHSFLSAAAKKPIALFYRTG